MLTKSTTIEANRIVFTNEIHGVQNNANQFFCPKDIPFASDVILLAKQQASSTPIIGNLSGYMVTIGYTITTANTIITQVTCSNMPDYEINAILH